MTKGYIKTRNYANRQTCFDEKKVAAIFERVARELLDSRELFDRALTSGSNLFVQ